jgi:hypothetical protein
MTKRQAQRYACLCDALWSHGLKQEEIDTLLRCQKTLHTWAEHECNGDIERDETTGKTYRVYGQDIPDAKIRRYRTPDRETGALKRIAAILAPHAPKQYTAETCPGRPCGADCDHANSGLTFYYQTDPRGCCLYILRPGDVPEGKDVDAYYSRGIAVCID